MNSFNLGKFIKLLRNKHHISQRALAEKAQVSFPQIQRIEKNLSSATIKTLNKILNTFGKELKIVCIEPNWNYLIKCGLPLSYSNKTKKHNTFAEEIKRADAFLKEQKHVAIYKRYTNAFKGLLLALLTHYPSKLEALNTFINTNLVKDWDLLNYSGKHIKLRNISLAIISKNKSIWSEIKTQL